MARPLIIKLFLLQELSQRDDVMRCINSNDVITRLKDFGVTVNDSDLSTIELIINGTEEYIKNFCNITVIPVELHYTAVDMCCGTYLKTKSSIGELEVMDPEGDVASITEGDVSISYKSGTSSSTIMKDTIDRLCNKKGELIPFRKLRW